MHAKLYVGNRNYSSWSIRGSLLVRQSGLLCEEIVIPLDTDEFYARIGPLSPSGRVPVLHAAGAVVWDTLAIAEFLHEQRPDAGQPFGRGRLPRVDVLDRVAAERACAAAGGAG